MSKNIIEQIDFQLEGLVLEIDITNCDGTKYKKTHQYLK